MWYTFQIRKNRTKEIVIESKEEYQEKDTAQQLAKKAYEKMSDNANCHWTVIPAKEYFTASLKNIILNFDIEKAEKIVCSIGDYISAGGEITKEEDILLETITKRLVSIKTSLYEACE